MKKSELLIEISQLEQQCDKLHSGYELLLRSLPVIHLGSSITADEDIKTLIDLATKGAATLLKCSFDACNLKTHIDTTLIFESTEGIESDNETFKLTFIKQFNPPPPLFAKR